jgi:twinkle protein
MTINGYEIEKYNIHGIKEKATTSICPLCSHNRKKSSEKCMSVFWDTGLGQCNHCGERVQLHTYKPKQSFKKYIEPVEIVKSEISHKVITYFKENRGISEGTLNHLKIRDGKQWMLKAQKEIDVIEFKYYLHGKLVNIKYRGAGKDFKFIKDAKIIPYNIDSIIGSTIAYIVEGEVDCCSLIESGLYSVISVPNGFSLPRKDGTSTINLEYLDDFIDLFDKCEKIVLATDNDEAGRHGRDELIRRLGSDKCYTVNFGDCKDANEYLLKYGKEKLREALENYEPIPLENVKTISDTWESLKEFWKNGDKKGFTVGLREMDLACSFSFSQYTLLVSAANSGKSEKLDDICIRLNMRYGLKVAFCSPENETKLHHHKWVLKVFGKTPNISDIGSEILENVGSYINENFYSVVDTGDIVTTLAKFRELYKRKGVKIFVLDPFNRVRLKGTNRSDVNEYTELYHAELDKFVKETNSHLFLALHPVKMKPNPDGKTFPIPSAYESKGGGEHFDMSYNILGMARDFERNCVNFRILKWKYSHLGSVGKEWCEAWNFNNGRYADFRLGYEPTDNRNHEAEWDNECWVESINDEPPAKITNIEAFESEANTIPKQLSIEEINF